MRLSGPAGAPGLVATVKVTASTPPGPGSEGAAKFAADGKAVDPDGLATHAKAIDYQNKNPGTAYLDAVRAVS